MRTLSSQALQALYAQETATAFHLLITISHPTLATGGTDTFVGGATTSALSSQGASHSYAGSGSGGLYAVF